MPEINNKWKIAICALENAVADMVSIKGKSAVQLDIENQVMKGFTKILKNLSKLEEMNKKMNNKIWPKGITKKFKSKLIGAHIAIEDNLECPVDMVFFSCSHISFIPDKNHTYGYRQISPNKCGLCEGVKP